jgi:nucleoside-diphosphate-sugar epimerase
MPASEKRALVTGGTGTVGRAVVSRLIRTGWDVRVLTRRAEGAGTDGVTYVLGDLENSSAIKDAVDDCTLVVHCALTKSGADVRAAGSLADAAIGAGVRRFVHVSTMSVYAVPSSGTIDESSQHVPANSRDIYARMKATIEHTLLTRAARLPLGIIQPANVISADGGWWTAGVIELMRKGRFILVDGGAGTANLVSVDDVAAAALLAAEAEYESGSRFLIADGHPKPWRGYLKHLEQLAGVDALEEMTGDEAKRYSASALHASMPARIARKISRRISGSRPILPMEDFEIDRFASRAVVSIERARRVLGFSPQETRWPGAPPASPPKMR